MKNFPGAHFIKRVIELFREEPDAPASAQENKPLSKNDAKYAGDATRAANQKDHPSGKAYESNIDRYKHPSDLYRSGY